MSKWILVGPTVGIILVAFALIFGYVIVPPLIVSRVTESVQLIEGTEQFDRWMNVPQPLDFKVYIFNVTNVAEVQLGRRPRVQEIGPYIYTQRRWKHDVEFSRDKERVSYYSQMGFEFNEEKSAPFKEDDDITVFSMHMQSIFKASDELFPGILPVYNLMMEDIFGPTNSMFTRTTPKQFLFDGIEFCKDVTGDVFTLCDIIEQRESKSIVRSADGSSLKFSMFAHKNRTHDGRYEINTGIRRLDRLLEIQRWERKGTLQQWKSNADGSPSVCQEINGTDATAAPPFREEGDDYYIFSSDICRSVHLIWRGETEYEGIRGFRYSSDETFLNEIPNCFCINKTVGTGPDGCLWKGAIDLTDCIDAPVIATMPHFLNADVRYLNMIDGLRPDPELHDVFSDLEPYTGSPLRGGKKLQFNIFIEKMEGIDITANFGDPILMPILWVDEGIELNEEMVALVKGDLTNTLNLINIIQWTLVGVGSALFVVTLIWYFIARKNLKKKKNDTEAKTLTDEIVEEKDEKDEKDEKVNGEPSTS